MTFYGSCSSFTYKAINTHIIPCDSIFSKKNKQTFKHQLVQLCFTLVWAVQFSLLSSNNIKCLDLFCLWFTGACIILTFLFYLQNPVSRQSRSLLQETGGDSRGSLRVSFLFFLFTFQLSGLLISHSLHSLLIHIHNKSF